MPTSQTMPCREVHDCLSHMYVPRADLTGGLDLCLVGELNGGVHPVLGILYACLHQVNTARLRSSSSGVGASSAWGLASSLRWTETRLSGRWYSCILNQGEKRQSRGPRSMFVLRSVRSDSV